MQFHKNPGGNPVFVYTVDKQTCGSSTNDAYATTSNDSSGSAGSGYPSLALGSLDGQVTVPLAARTIQKSGS